jgi:hypothetical protein
MPAAPVRCRRADDTTAAMREKYYTDRKGRRVRLLHPARLLAEGERHVLWDDIHMAAQPHMTLSIQNRRKGIIGDCHQFKIDVDSYNESHPEQEPIQIVFNFEMDLAGIEAAEAAG